MMMMAAANLRFNPRAIRSIDAGNAAWLAACCLAARHGADPAPALARLGAPAPKEFRFLAAARGGPDGLVALWPEFSVVALSLSGKAREWVGGGDERGRGRIRKHRAAWAPGRVHGGFAEALEGFPSLVRQALPPPGGAPLWVAGHGLGGALAPLLGFALGARAFGVVTFGQPMVGSESMFARRPPFEYWRLANGLDPMPLLPNAFSAGDYAHGGRFGWLNGGGLAQGASAENRHASQARPRAAQDGRWDSVGDHSIAAYCEALQKCL